MNKVEPVVTSSLTEQKRPSLLISVRFLMAIILGFCYLINYMQRTNMSIAIVCMVNSSAVLELEGSENLANSSGQNLNCVAETSDKYSSGKFVWLKSDQGLILSAYFYGYILTQVPGGWLALKFGGLWVIGLSTLASSILTILVAPIANLNSIAAIFVLRFFIGLCHGFVLPAISYMFTKWAPPHEKSSLMGISVAGTNIGSVVSSLLGSYLCEYGFYYGWGSIFVIFGGFGLVWLLSLVFLASESPTTHRFISDAERMYILKHIPESKKKKSHTPWILIFKSKSCLVIFVAHFCMNWGAYLLLTQIPTYMKEVLKFDIKSNGLYSSIPYLASVVCVLCGGYISDKLISHGLLSRTNARKLFNSLGLFVPMICAILLGLVVDCTQPFVGVLLLTIATGSMGFVNSAGYGVAVIDVAGQYAGVLYGISNTFATVPGIVAPYLVGLLTPNGTREEWNVVFIITAVVHLIGGLPFVFFFKSDLEEWALVHEKSKSSNIK